MHIFHNNIYHNLDMVLVDRLAQEELVHQNLNQLAHQLDQNLLVHQLDFNNVKHPEESFSGKSFSAYADYDSSNDLDAVESTLCTEIIDKIIEDIFNATVAQW